ncbi:hypothetical protein CHS0354_008488 [Potamilus streckersoni]|uniref:Mitochondria-eating protein n=1 Tax=Potamilus streckersoni TaxID=2493646 RepID=A0AAE0SEH2_9BIVA|nr:hypothetical protein CHS0354_008488 [Potamilus streckersoni]
MGSGKMDRIKPEKLPRQRVQKLWRNVRWAESFPDESLSVELTDVPQSFTLRKVAQLFETKKYGECATLIRRLNCVALEAILQEVPVEVLLDSLPHSLVILESLYVKLYEETETPGNFPREELKVDEFLQKLVAFFAKDTTAENNKDKNSNIIYPCCRNILRVVSWIEPSIRKHIRQLKQALDKCISRLGRHGLVNSSSGNLMGLHDSLKVEFEKVVSQYKSALQKLAELDLTTKHPTSSSVTFGPAPTRASHQRLMQVTRTDVQSRIIKNKTVFNIVEPAVMSQCLKKLVHILEKRIEYDKMTLFHETEVRKMCSGIDDDMYISVTLKQFSSGYDMVLKLLREVADECDGLIEEEEEEATDLISSDEEAASPLLQVDAKFKEMSSLNGLLPYRTAGTRPSVISGPFLMFPEKTIPHGHATLIPNPMATNPVTANQKSSEAELSSLEQEVENLKAELEKSQGMIKHLQEREKMLLDRLSGQVHASFSLSGMNGQFEDLNLGTIRPTELIRQFGNLYSEARVEALDALDALDQFADLQALKEKILFSVIVLAFRSAQQNLVEIKGKVRHLLSLPCPDTSEQPCIPVAIEMECHITNYLRKRADTFDVEKCVEEVSSQIYATLYDYPDLKTCLKFHQYIAECVHVAWGLSVQTPAYLILYDSRIFQADLHERFHTSDPDSNVITSFLWPALIEGCNGPCIQKAFVTT